MRNFNTWLLLPILALASALVACRFALNLPAPPSPVMKTIPVQTDAIQVPALAGPVAALELNFAAGKLSLSPGGGSLLVDGTATYNLAELKPEVVQEGRRTVIRHRQDGLSGIPPFSRDLQNTWDLKLGSMPIDLVVKSGADTSSMELGGLALHSLEVTSGASRSRISFSQPNPERMEELRIESGASTVDLQGLGNANFRDLVLRGGAGQYTLDFSGALKDEAHVRIETGVSKVNLLIPSGMNAHVAFNGALSNIHTTGGWQQEGEEYVLSGSGPTVWITLSMGAGDVELRELK